MIVDAFSQIVWGNPQLRDQKVWEANVKVVEMLCQTGAVSVWQEGQPGKDGYIKMPYHYDVEGVDVQFLPHWGFYTVGGIDLNVPETKEDVRMAVEAVKILQRLGFKTKKK
jgi:hypothetical protein